MKPASSTVPLRSRSVNQAPDLGGGVQDLGHLGRRLAVWRSTVTSHGLPVTAGSAATASMVPMNPRLTTAPAAATTRAPAASAVRPGRAKARRSPLAVAGPAPARRARAARRRPPSGAVGTSRSTALGDWRTARPAGTNTLTVSRPPTSRAATSSERRAKPGPDPASTPSRPAWKRGASGVPTTQPRSTPTAPSRRCSAHTAARSWRGVKPVAASRPRDRRRATRRAAVAPATTKAAATRRKTPKPPTRVANTEPTTRMSPRVSVQWLAPGCRRPDRPGGDLRPWPPTPDHGGRRRRGSPTAGRRGPGRRPSRAGRTGAAGHRWARSSRAGRRRRPPPGGRWARSGPSTVRVSPTAATPSGHQRLLDDHGVLVAGLGPVAGHQVRGGHRGQRFGVGGDEADIDGVAVDRGREVGDVGPGLGRLGHRVVVGRGLEGRRPRRRGRGRAGPPAGRRRRPGRPRWSARRGRPPPRWRRGRRRRPGPGPGPSPGAGAR